MIYIQHNVKGNFMSANGFGDNQMKQDIILSEIAKLIVVKPELVVDYLNKAGFKVNGIPSKGRLVSLVTKGLRTSKEFATMIAKEIVGAGSTLNSNGESTGTGSGTDWGSIANSTASIIGSISQMFASNKPPVQTQQNLNNHVNAVHNIANDGWSTGVKVLVGFAIGIPLVIGTIFAIKHFNK